MPVSHKFRKKRCFPIHSDVFLQPDVNVLFVVSAPSAVLMKKKAKEEGLLVMRLSMRRLPSKCQSESINRKDSSTQDWKLNTITSVSNPPAYSSLALRKLWKRKLISYCRHNGFSVTETDSCHFNVSGNRQFGYHYHIRQKSTGMLLAWVWIKFRIHQCPWHSSFSLFLSLCFCVVYFEEARFFV